MTNLLQSVFLKIVRTNNGNNALFNAYRLCSTELTRLPPPIKNQDFLMETIKTSSTPDKLLNAVSQHIQVMNQKHLVQVLRSLFDLQKQPRSHCEDITKNPTFGLLCQALKRQARVLEPNEYIEALKVLSYLQVPINSVIVQTLLQLVRNNINYFNLRQIIFLDFILSKYDDKSPLVDALKLALPLVFQIHLPMELDKEDLPLLKDMLYFSCARQLPDRCINNIVTALILSDHHLDALDAKGIIFALSEVNSSVDFYPTRVKLLHMCFGVLATSLQKLPFDDVVRLTSRLKNRIMEKHLEYYHVGLFDAIADYVVGYDISFEKSLLVARMLSRIGHTNILLLEYICNVACQDITVISKARTNMLFSLVNCLSCANYVPEQNKWSIIKEHISLNPTLELNNPTLPWSKFCRELASLGYYNLKVLSKLYSEEILHSYLSRDDNVLDYTHLLILHEAAKVFCPGYNLSPPKEVLEKAVAVHPPLSLNIQLEEALARGLGGKEYFATNVQLPNGIVVDHIVCLREGGQPVSIECSMEGKIDFRQLDIPKSVLTACILKFNKGCYSLNCDRLRGTYTLLIDLLQEQGYPVVPVNLHSWLEMPSAEQADYLIRELRFKCLELGKELCVT